MRCVGLTLDNGKTPSAIASSSVMLCSLSTRTRVNVRTKREAQRGIKRGETLPRAAAFGSFHSSGMSLAEKYLLVLLAW
jgi:hypothetical protein